MTPMCKAGALCASLFALATPGLAEGVRPKPRPVLAATPAAGLPAVLPGPVSGAGMVAEMVAGPQAIAAGQPAPLARPLAAPAIRSAAGAATTAAAGATVAAPALPRDAGKGAVTNLPLPRFVSLKTGEGNARRGPGLTHRIDWVFTLAGMPLKITAEHEHWRRVEDAEGLGGWVHYSLLSGVRTVLVIQPMTPFYSRADSGSTVVFQAEAGVVARVIECADGWCRVSVEGQKGWSPSAALWGVTADEVID